MSSVSLPPGVDIHGDQRGRIIGSAAAIITITVIFVLLRLLSRRLSGAGFWVRLQWLKINDHLLMVSFRQS